jgi:hypothetical protein
MKIATSMITNTIYAGNTRKDKSGLELWTKKTDVTDDVLRAAFEYMYHVAKETGKSQIAIDGFGKMTFEREEKVDDKEE